MLRHGKKAAETSTVVDAWSAWRAEASRWEELEVMRDGSGPDVRAMAGDEVVSVTSGRAGRKGRT